MVKQMETGRLTRIRNTAVWGQPGEHGLVSEALGRKPPGHYVLDAQAPDAGNMENPHESGQKRNRKEKYLRPLVEGKYAAAFPMPRVEVPGSNPVIEHPPLLRRRRLRNQRQKWYTNSCRRAQLQYGMAV